MTLLRRLPCYAALLGTLALSHLADDVIGWIVFSGWTALLVALDLYAQRRRRRKNDQARRLARLVLDTCGDQAVTSPQETPGPTPSIAPFVRGSSG